MLLSPKHSVHCTLSTLYRNNPSTGCCFSISSRWQTFHNVLGVDLSVYLICSRVSGKELCVTILCFHTHVLPTRSGIERGVVTCNGLQYSGSTLTFAVCGNVHLAVYTAGHYNQLRIVTWLPCLPRTGCHSRIVSYSMGYRCIPVH